MGVHIDINEAPIQEHFIKRVDDLLEEKKPKAITYANNYANNTDDWGTYNVDGFKSKNYCSECQTRLYSNVTKPENIAYCWKCNKAVKIITEESPVVTPKKKGKIKQLTGSWL